MTSTSRTVSVASAVAAIVIGFFLGLSFLQSEEIGATLCLTVPATMGFVLGLYGSAGLILRNTLLFLTVLGLTLSLLVFCHAMGFFCALMALPVLAVPMLMGFAVGCVIGRDPPASAPPSPEDERRRNHLLIFVLVLPGLTHVFEKWTRSPDPELSRDTVTVLAASPDVVWDSLRFYDELDHPAPWIFHVGFPRPVRTEGTLERAGDRQVCHYDKGDLRKVLTDVDPGRGLVFRVESQDIGFERSVRLIGGSFELEPEGEGTRLTLTTTYEARLHPRFIWSPLEAWIVRSLHEYIMEGVELEMCERAGMARSDVGVIRPGTDPSSSGRGQMQTTRLAPGQSPSRLGDRPRDALTPAFILRVTRGLTP